MKSINPTTEEVFADYPDHTPQQVEQLLDQAESAFTIWRAFSFDQRGELLRRVGELLLEQKSDLSILMTREMGKTIAGAESEIEKCASACEYFANHAQRLLAVEEIPTDASKSYVRFDPLGPILAIMPWNFPFWQVFRFAAAASARNINAGQSCIAAKRFIVHESIAEEFERLFADRMTSLRLGDPMDRNTDIGPLARGDLRDQLDDQVKRTLAAGARLLCGGKKPAVRG